jgi:hypothetical protein
VAGNRYSVPVGHVGAPVTVRLHRDRIRIWRDTVLLADHPRAPDGARRRVIEVAHFAPLFARKPRAQVMLYREVLIGLGGVAPAFVSELSRRYRAQLGPEVLAVYRLLEQAGAQALRQAMAVASAQGRYSAAALEQVLTAPEATPVPILMVPGVPLQGEVDRRLSVYEAWVQIDEAALEVAP